MHFYEAGWFWGMHIFWWFFWILMIVLFFWRITSVPRHGVRETPLEILQRRYAAGDFSSEEYEERKAKLERDAPSGRR